jgi:hypothetical protein
MDKETKKKVGIGAAIAGLIAVLFLRKTQAAPPPPPPDKASLYGLVTDEVSGQGIQGIQVSFADYATVTKANGYYVIENITPGSYQVTFYDPSGIYQTAVL